MKIVNLIIAAFTAFALTARADEELTKAARKIFAEHQDSVIWVTAVAKISIKTIGGTGRNIPDQEKKIETPGTVIDASGLILSSLSVIDPSSAMDGQEFPSAGGTMKVSSSAKITDVKIIMPGGTEIPPDITMKDTDLDLAIIKVRKDSPEAKGVKFNAIDLKNNIEGHVLDEVVALGRSGESFGRQPSVITSLVISETKKPRHFMRVPTDTIGGPVFVGSGKLIGITTLRRVRSESQSGQIAMLPVVLPAADIIPIAAQALKAQPKKEDDGTKSDQ
jgi:S1-C subfamily serine protease